MRKLVLAAAVLLCGAPSQACSRQPAGAPPPAATGGSMEQQPAAGVSDLPFAAGMTFASLDDYLAHLRRRGAYDVPWYREVSPGVYERVGGRAPPGAPPERFTREQLERRFGFAR